MGSLSLYLQGFIHPRLFGISSINCSNDDGDSDDDDERPQDTVGPKTFAFQMPKAASILATMPEIERPGRPVDGSKPTWWKMYVVYTVNIVCIFPEQHNYIEIHR